MVLRAGVTGAKSQFTRPSRRQTSAADARTPPPAVNGARCSAVCEVLRTFLVWKCSTPGPSQGGGVCGAIGRSIWRLATLGGQGSLLSVGGVMTGRPAPAPSGEGVGRPSGCAVELAIAAGRGGGNDALASARLCFVATAIGASRAQPWGQHAGARASGATYTCSPAPPPRGPSSQAPERFRTA